MRGAEECQGILPSRGVRALYGSDHRRRALTSIGPRRLLESMTWRRAPFYVLAVLLLPSLVRAQSAGDDAVCLGFAFGTWKPKLDWKAAGHPAFPDSSRMLHAPSGRDWAYDDDKGDSALVLVPSWWPAGVVVYLKNRAPASGDTVTGEAIAMRAIGDSVSPRAPVRAWRVPCRRGAAPR